MKITKKNYLSNLNNNQKEAIMELDGPCLIVAGAGSGKTKVLTTRVIHIIKEKKAWPNQILCVTFTNKAAKEMQNRIVSSLNEKTSSLPWLGTFHSVSAKLLRRHAEAVGLNSRFTIIDQEDQLRLIKNICKAENIDIKKISPQFILSFINRWKNKGLLPKNVVAKKGIPLEKNILNVYKFYQDRLKILNSCDFGDLILLCVNMFENNPDILDLYLNNFKYILVDEYQDSNYIQSKWLKLLAKKRNNICCVGDDDQSIYSWRGAEIRNFLDFNKTYKNAKQMLVEVKPEIVSISTWKDTHFKFCKMCILNGVKVIVLEKPLANTLKQSKILINLIKKYKTKVLVNHRRRYDEEVIKLRNLIKKKKIGKIKQVSCFYVYGLLTTGTHVVDTLRMLLNDVAGEIVKVVGFKNNNDDFPALIYR